MLRVGHLDFAGLKAKQVQLASEILLSSELFDYC